MIRDYRKFILAMGLLCCVVTASAVGKWDFKSDGIYYKILSFDDLTVAVANSSSNPDPSKYSAESYKGDVVIPTTVNDSYSKSYTVVKINKYAFYSCTDLTSVSIPETITEIEDEAFVDNTSLTALDLPSSVATIGANNFSGSGLAQVEVWNRVVDTGFLAAIPATATIYVHSNCYNSAAENFSGENLHTLEKAYATVKEVADLTTMNTITITISRLRYDVTMGYAYLLTNDGNKKKMENNKISGLIMDTQYDVAVECKLKVGRTENLYYEVSTRKPKVVVSRHGATMEQITLGISAETADGCPTLVKTGFGDVDADSNNSVLIGGLMPDETITDRPFATYSDGRTFYGEEYSFTTEPVYIQLSKYDNYATEMKIKVPFCETGLLTIEEYGFLSSEDAEDFSGETMIELKNLVPETDYEVIYGIRTTERGIITTKKTFTTDAPTWQLQSTDHVSTTDVVMELKTNYTGVEGSGFEYWKAGTSSAKTFDVPLLYKRMEALMSDLNEGTEYKYRAYYKAANGKKYYSDVMSYVHNGEASESRITPNVYTMPDVVVNGTTVTLRGYYTKGTDEISAVGFDMSGTFYECDWERDGWFEATITGLTPNKEYMAHSTVILPPYTHFVSTDRVRFTTGASSAIDDIATDSEGIDGECVVTSISGVVVASGKLWSEVKEGLNAGIYIVTIGNKTIKVVV